MPNIHIVPATELEEREQRETIAELIHLSFAEFYTFFAEPGDYLFRNLAEQMTIVGSELGNTYAALDGDTPLGAFSWYPAAENATRQMVSLKTLMKISGQPATLMPRLRDFSSTVPVQGMEGAYLSRIAVHPRARRRGIGSLLLEAFERQAVADGFTHACLHVRKDNDSGRKFYEQLGYGSICPSSADYCIMKKTLS